MKNTKDAMIWQRKILSIFGMLLPILAPLTGFLAYSKNGPEFWYSISATFYATSNIFMIGVLAIFAFFLWSYQGYDLGDKYTCNFSAAMAIGILLFPCKCLAAGDTTGVFNLPTYISNILHCIIAALLFGSFAYMIGFRFTKTRYKKLPVDKIKRNRIYRICALIIALAMVSQVITSLLDIGWFTIINEAIMLWAFSFAWAVKANMFKRFRDK